MSCYCYHSINIIIMLSSLSFALLILILVSSYWCCYHYNNQTITAVSWNYLLLWRPTWTENDDLFAQILISLIMAHRFWLLLIVKKLCELASFSEGLHLHFVMVILISNCANTNLINTPMNYSLLCVSIVHKIINQTVLQFDVQKVWALWSPAPCCGNNIHMMTSWNRNIFRVTGLLCGEFIDCSPVNSSHTKASDAELWCFLWSASEPAAEQTMETPVIWDAIVLIMTSL